MAENKTVIKSSDKKSDIKLTLLQPRATEKTYNEQTKRTYAFFVDSNETKQSVAARVEKDYNVKVTDVRILTRKGKKCRFSRGKHAYPGTAFRRDHKLAYVTLAEGNSIRVFEAPEKKEAAKDVPAKKTKVSAETSKDDKKVSAKEAKKADKKADKENK